MCVRYSDIWDSLVKLFSVVDKGFEPRTSLI